MMKALTLGILMMLTLPDDSAKRHGLNFFFGLDAGNDEAELSGYCNILIGNGAGKNVGPGTRYAFQIDEQVTTFVGDDGRRYDVLASLQNSISHWHSKMDPECLHNYRRALRILQEHKGGTYTAPSK